MFITYNKKNILFSVFKKICKITDLVTVTKLRRNSKKKYKYIFLLNTKKYYAILIKNLNNINNINKSKNVSFLSINNSFLFINNSDIV